MSRSAPEGKGAAVRLAAHRILRRVEEAGAYASILLDAETPAFHDSRDRALLHEIVLGVLRRRSILDHVISAAASRPPRKQDPPVRTALRVGAYTLLYLDRIPPYAAVDTAVDLVKRDRLASAAGFVNGTLRRIVKEKDTLLPPDPARGDAAGLALSQGHPEWWTARVVERQGWDRTVALLQANNRPATSVLRINPRKTDGDELAARLRREEVEVEPGVLVPGAMRVRAGIAQETDSFRSGLFYLQDEASQMVPWMFGKLGGGRIADFCAAPGGKTFQLADRLPAGGLVVAADRHPGRLRRLLANAARLGCGPVAAVAADLAAGRSCFAGRFDHVLLDAPCSGTGTFRRHPELRWRLQADDLHRAAVRQGKLLRNAAERVAPGGSLVYSVCSMEPEEGERVVVSFLRSRGDFRIADPRPNLPEPCRRFAGKDRMVRTSPADGEWDGFFAALLFRES